MNVSTSATAFAPASAGCNVAIGFDILGFAVDALGDKVSVTRTAQRGVTITGITGVNVDLPRNPEGNTAGRAVMAMQETLDLPFGFDMRIEKGIPLGSGLGGSAASPGRCRSHLPRMRCCPMPAPSLSC